MLASVRAVVYGTMTDGIRMTEEAGVGQINPFIFTIERMLLFHAGIMSINRF